MYSPDYRLLSKVQKELGGDNVHEANGLLALVTMYHYLWKKLGHFTENQAERAEVAIKMEEAEKKLRQYYWGQIKRR